ncbi:MAG: protein kinase domain-containing protein [Xenococcaceae cyanobacterium]
MDKTILAGRYQIVRHLGGGGFGQTFLARDIHMPGKPLCVVKQLKTESFTNNLATAKRLFDREAETLYKLGNNERIPRLLAHFEQDNQFYLVQDFIDGDTLDKELISGQPWSEEKVCAFLKDTLQVLAFVHQQNVIHRDLKPTNLIRRRNDGKIVLIDFGAVKEVTSQNTSLTVAIGSPGYMPPEQQAYKPKFCSDLYALGMICLQALTGLSVSDILPNIHSGEYTYAELEADERALVTILQKRTPISADLETIINTMVRKDYRQRYQTALAALQALKQLDFPSNISIRAETSVTPSTSSQLPSTNFSANSASRSQNVVTPQTNNSQMRSAQTSSKLPSENFQTYSTPSSSELKQLKPAFVQLCRQELALYIGPFANFIIEDTLAENPHLTPQQLIEILAEEIPSPQKAKQFRDKLF